MNNCRLLLLFLFLTVASALNAQHELWQAISSFPAENGFKPVEGLVTYRIFKLDTASLSTLLEKARTDGSVSIELPLPDTGRHLFRIHPTQVMAAGLARKYPGMVTFSGRSIQDPRIGIRLDRTPKGLHAMVLSPNADYYIDPVSHDGQTYYFCYFREDVIPGDRHGCKTTFAAPVTFRGNAPERGGNGDTLRLYRLAVAATGGYTQFHGGTVEDALSAIVTSINRVNGIYERDLAVRLVLVEETDRLIFTDPETDPYTRNNQKNENQSVLDDRIGEDNYDIGHVFGVEGDSRAEIGSACIDGEKAMGSSLSGNPTGDSFHIDLIAHEIGHQLGATHTFNYCFNGFQGDQPFEPGSGSTIMGWAGLCEENNLQPNSDAYFHGASIREIVTYTTTGEGRSCASLQPLLNAIPSAFAGEGDWIVPVNTPFELTGSGNDADGDLLTYTWEEIDAGPATPVEMPEGTAPLFRSWAPTADSVRIFPRKEFLLDNESPLGEVLPGYGRPLNFLLTVRDQRGGIAWDTLRMEVTEEAGPFRVQSLNEPGMVLNAGAELDLRWNVANTDRAPVNASGVNVYLSSDSGKTFPLLLAGNVPNHGMTILTIPDTARGDNFRLKVKAVDNVFFDVNDFDFSIEQSTGVLRPPVDNRKKIQIYPNPVGDQVWIDLGEGSKEGILRLWSAAGQLLRVKEISADKMQMDMKEIPAGLYFLEWQSAGSRWSRVVKK